LHKSRLRSRLLTGRRKEPFFLRGPWSKRKDAQQSRADRNSPGEKGHYPLPRSRTQHRRELQRGKKRCPTVQRKKKSGNGPSATAEERKPPLLPEKKNTCSSDRRRITVRRRKKRRRKRYKMMKRWGKKRRDGGREFASYPFQEKKKNTPQLHIPDKEKREPPSQGDILVKRERQQKATPLTYFCPESTFHTTLSIAFKL